MTKKLLIVESPAKAKTIEKYLGSDFSVKSSYGHIRDLEKGNDLAVDVEHDYHPKYVVPSDKFKTVKELKEAAKGSQEVWLATDEDREGEAISWHLCEVLGLDVLHVANEGQCLAIVAADAADRALAAIRSVPGGEEAVIIGTVSAERKPRLTAITPYGSSRIVDMLVGDQLPRIC